MGETAGKPEDGLGAGDTVFETELRKRGLAHVGHVDEVCKLKPQGDAADVDADCAAIADGNAAQTGG